MLARLASSRVTAYARAEAPRRDEVTTLPSSCRAAIRNRHGRNCSFGLQNAYQHFRKDAPRALYRSIDSCSNCHQISRTKPA
jgi:hypothetical protein